MNYILLNTIKNKLKEARTTIDEITLLCLEFENKFKEISKHTYSIDLMQQSGIALLEIDLEGFIVNVNDNFADLIKAKPSQIIGKRHQDLLATKVIFSVEYMSFLNSILEGKSFSGEVSYLTRCNDVTYVFATYFLIENEDGFPLKIIEISY